MLANAELNTPEAHWHKGQDLVSNKLFHDYNNGDDDHNHDHDDNTENVDNARSRTELLLKGSRVFLSALFSLLSIA